MRDGRRRWVLAGLGALLVLGLVAALVLGLRGTWGQDGPRGSTGGSSRGPDSTSVAPVRVTVASFNVLGSTHTAARGNRAELASGVERAQGVVRLLQGHGVSLVGFQEMQPDQRAAFRRLAPGWRLLEGRGVDPRSGENAVAWRTDTWSVVRSAMLPVPDTAGAVRPVPVVLLRHRASGVLVVLATFHPAADTRRFPDQQRFREAATRRQVALAARVAASGVPLLVTGDMNERDGYFCRVTDGTGLHAAAGGSSGAGGCTPPPAAPIDWVLGSQEVGFSGYRVDRSALVRRTTDHPVVLADVRLDVADLPHGQAPADLP
ncbi:MAG: Endonuclease/Exonuclease/phosphatase family protein [Marmoricola sp.]|nr:Endonuclease/Exonuclease/phosphatase family protein [Marmoricola sp.]